MVGAGMGVKLSSAGHEPLAHDTRVAAAVGYSVGRLRLVVVLQHPTHQQHTATWLCSAVAGHTCSSSSGRPCCCCTAAADGRLSSDAAAAGVGCRRVGCCCQLPCLRRSKLVSDMPAAPRPPETAVQGRLVCSRTQGLQRRVCWQSTTAASAARGSGSGSPQGSPRWRCTAAAAEPQAAHVYPGSLCCASTWRHTELVQLL
ncbi:hypothetical protein COO60DRAFT_24034 [Scenedesmus sp. NREL 46B-D3]|nr:hypothetical protein COO60DRAFT_24034 [Scenedesmus sp. NREL 46B-D3]